MGQNPYAGEEACGIPFVSAQGHLTQSLKNIRRELHHEYPHLVMEANINHLISKSWIQQGVFLLNMALTTSEEEEAPYLADHTVLWREFVQATVDYLTRGRSLPVILMGSVAWDLEVGSSPSIKVPHPVSRDERFIGCGVFTRCNQYLERPILWMVAEPQEDIPVSD